jgi:hypothetical protein
MKKPVIGNDRFHIGIFFLNNYQKKISVRNYKLKLHEYWNIVNIVFRTNVILKLKNTHFLIFKVPQF